MRLKQHLLVFFIFISISSFSQIASHILFHPNTINAAYAGSDARFHLGVNYHFQAGGIEGSPRSVLLNMHTPVYKGVGVGFSYNTGRIGAVEITTTSMDLSYKYQIDKNNQLSIGVKRLDYSANLSFLIDSQINDINDSKVLASTSYDVGLFYQTPHFFVGLATMNLFNDGNSIFGTASISPTYMANSGFLVTISEGVILKPSLSVFVKESYFYYLIASQLNIQTLEASLYYSDGDLLGVGIMSPKLFKALKIGFNYEYMITNNYNYSSSFYNVIAKFEIKGFKKSSKTKSATN